MIFTKNRGLSGAGYLLAGHPQAELTMKQVNNLYDLAMILDKGLVASGLQIQRFKTVVPALGTTNVTFTDTVQACTILGGYWSITGVDEDYDMDIGHSGLATALAEDLVVLIGSEVYGSGPIVTDYLDAEDVILTITSNSNTGPVTVEITLLTVKLVTA